MNVWIEAPFDNLPMEGFRRQRYWLMAEAFAAAGHRVTLWTSDFNHGTKRKRLFVAPAPPSGAAINVVLIPTKPYAKNVSLRRVASHWAYAYVWSVEAERYEERPDLVIVATPTILAASAGLRLKKRRGCRLVVDVQDAWPETFYRLLPKPIRALGPLLFAPIVRRARRLYREADLLTGVSERYRALTGRADFYLAYHGYASEVTAALPPPSKGPRRLVYVGNLGAGYDLGPAIEAIARKETLTLDIAGDGPKAAQWKDLAARLGVRERVIFHGYLDQASLAALLARSEIGVIPMRDDSWVGLPYKLGDYLAAGLPVVSSLHGECGELLERHRLGETYARTSADDFLSAVARIPHGHRVALPAELAAKDIYRDYVRHVTQTLGRTDGRFSTAS